MRCPAPSLGWVLLACLAASAFWAPLATALNVQMVNFTECDLATVPVFDFKNLTVIVRTSGLTYVRRVPHAKRWIGAMQASRTGDSPRSFDGLLSSKSAASAAVAALTAYAASHLLPPSPCHDAGPHLPFSFPTPPLLRNSTTNRRLARTLSFTRSLL